MNSIADVWSSVLRQMEKKLSETTIATWFDSDLEAVDLQGNVFYLHCSNDFKRNFIQELFLDAVKEALRDLFSRDIDVQFLDEEGYREFRQRKEGREQKRTPASISEEYTFESFVVGPTNKMAYAASIAVAERRTNKYNPLLIYGDSGLGKTHLMHAISNVIRKNSSAKIVYSKGDTMMNELIESIQQGTTADMREKYRAADLLLVDDVQFIAGKKQIQEEFFHTFNTLYESGRQIVLTSDRPPSEMTMLEDRLRTRFEGGLLVDVQPPDFETRMAIVRTKAASLGLQLPDRVVNYIAKNVTSNVRQLEGTIHKLMAYKDMLGDDTDETMVDRAIADVIQRTKEDLPTPDSITEYIAKQYQVDPNVIRSGRRAREAVAARQIAMYLVRAITNMPLEDVGKYFKRDHSTVMYSLKQVETRMQKDPAYAEEIKAIKTNLASNG